MPRRVPFLVALAGAAAVAALPSAAAAADAADSVRARYTKYEYRIPMRDGVKLFTSVYVPKDAGGSKRYPILLNRTPYSVAPYGSDAYPDSVGPSEAAAKEGFIFVYQDVRGRFMSEGAVRGRAALQPREGAEGHRRVERHLGHDRLAGEERAATTTARSGIWGISYPGFYAAMAAIDAHPALEAASPQAPIADWFIGDDFHHNGAFFLPHAFNFYTALRQAAPRADHEVAAALRPRHRRRLRVLPRAGPMPNLDRKYLKGEVAFWNEVMAHETLRRLLAGPQHAAAPEGDQARGADRGRLVRRRGPLRRARDLPVDRAQSPGIANRLVMGPWPHGGWSRSDGRRARQGDVRPADLEVLRGADRAAVLPLLPEGRRRPEAARGLRLRDRRATRGTPSTPGRRGRRGPLALYLSGSGRLSPRSRLPRRRRPSTSTSPTRRSPCRSSRTSTSAWSASTWWPTSASRRAGRTSSCTRPSRWRRT